MTMSCRLPVVGTKAKKRRRPAPGRHCRPVATGRLSITPSTTNGTATLASPPTQLRSSPTVLSPSRLWPLAGVEKSSCTTYGRRVFEASPLSGSLLSSSLSYLVSVSRAVLIPIGEVEKHQHVINLDVYAGPKQNT